MFYTRSISVFWVLFLACTVLRYPKDAQVGCVRPIGSYWTRLEFPRNETTRENFICQDALVLISKSSSTRICIWDKRVSLTEKMPLLYCTRIASFYSIYAYTCNYKGMPCPTFLRLPRIKSHKRPCAYYSSTNASCHVPLLGDLVFKLNPGPVRSLDNGSCSIVSRQWQSDTTTALPNTGNPIAVTVSQRAYQELRADRDTRNLIEIRPTRMDIRLYQQMLLCNLNAHSVRNKTARILDFIVDRKVDLVAITEHWLTRNDSDVRFELCPNGYCIVDHSRLDHRGGGLGSSIVTHSVFLRLMLELVNTTLLNSPSGL